MCFTHAYFGWGLQFGRDSFSLVYTLQEMAAPRNNDGCAPLVPGGYDYDFVDSPPESLQCPVCLFPFRDPTLLSCCGHKGCASCIGRIKAAGHPCPMCQQPFDTMLEKQLQRKVMDLRVFCPKKREGCEWEGELRKLETHSQGDCAHVEHECRYRCGGYYLRRFLRDHEMDECPQRPQEVITQSLIRKMAERIEKLEATTDNAQQEHLTEITAVHAKLAAIEKIHDDAILQSWKLLKRLIVRIRPKLVSRFNSFRKRMPLYKMRRRKRFKELRKLRVNYSKVWSSTYFIFRAYKTTKMMLL